MPNARIGSLFGTQYQNAALRAVPPSSGAFSSRITSLPSHRENKAEGRPPPADHDDVGFRLEVGHRHRCRRVARCDVLCVRHSNPLLVIAANDQVDGLMMSDLLVAVVFQADTPVFQYTPSPPPRPPPSPPHSNPHLPARCT